MVQTGSSNARPPVQVVTLSINNNIKFLENIKQGFKRTIFGTYINLKQLHKQKTTI